MKSIRKWPIICSHTINTAGPVAARSKAGVCGRAEIVGSNPTASMDVCLL